ncbi:MAG: hypothetical protein AAB426_00520 [Myxococcota bacterium]
MVRKVQLLLASSLLFTETSAQAQPRDSSRDEAVLEIVLPFAVRFGDQVVPARRYRLTLGADGFAFVDAQSMLLAATVAVEEVTSATAVTKPEVAIEVLGDAVIITLRHLDQSYHAHGDKIALLPSTERRVELAAKSETLLGDVAAESTSERQLIDQALVRHLVDVKHCADKAHRGRWQTDEPRFFACVCPLIVKWRLPRLAHAVRVHRPLTKGRHGFSFTVTPEGRATDCRVWAGLEPPADPVAPASTEAAAPTVEGAPTTP